MLYLNLNSIFHKITAIFFKNTLFLYEITVILNEITVQKFAYAYVFSIDLSKKIKVMKKLILLGSAIVTLVTLSCRQQDDLLTSEDTATLKIIQDKASARQLNDGITDKNLQGNVQNERLSLVDNEPVKPPK